MRTYSGALSPPTIQPMRTPDSTLCGIHHREVHHGRGIKPEFFESWWVKFNWADQSQRSAVILGYLSRACRSRRGSVGGSDTTEQPHDEAFVPVLDRLLDRSPCHRFRSRSSGHSIANSTFKSEAIGARRRL